jgi:AcrR family transcriptional regulator
LFLDKKQIEDKIKNERTFVFIKPMKEETSPPTIEGSKDDITIGDATKGERTRADIIRAAHDLFLQYGYHGTPMRQIAIQARIALGGIYNHFQSKDEIFQEVVLTYHPYHEIFPILANTPHENIEELLRHAARLIDETLSQRPELINLLFIEIVEFRSAHVPLLMERVFPLVAQILQRFMQAENTLHPIPFPMLMRTFMGMIVGYFVTKNVLGDHVPEAFRENALDYFIDIYLHGIIKPETPA